MKSIIKESIALREAIASRMAELNLNYSDVIKITVTEGNPINYQQFHSFMKVNENGSFVVEDKQYPKEADLIWLATRLGLVFDFGIKRPPYNQKDIDERLKRLKQGKLRITFTKYGE